MRITTLTSRRALSLAAALLTGLALAACGSSGSTNSAASAAAGGSAASGATGARGALATCLKAHGVTLPAGFGRFRRGVTGASGAFRPGAAGGPPGGPGANGGGFLFGAGRPGGATGGRGFAGRFANNPRLAAAFQACAGSFRGRFNPGNAAQFRARRQQVVNQFIACVKQHGFTDVPTPNFSGSGPVFPLALEKNKKFLAAAKSCTSLLRFGGAAGPGGGAPPGGAPA